MQIVRCNTCGWLGCEGDLVDSACPQCHSAEQVEHWIDWTMDEFSTRDLETLWELFGDIPIDDGDNILEDFFGFEAGTNRFDIWHWFDERYPAGVRMLMLVTTMEEVNK